MRQSGVLRVLERARDLDRRYEEGVAAELERRRIRDINATRALICLNLGSQELTTSELLATCYMGTNISYNLKKLVEHGWIVQRRLETDKRVVMVRNTEKALELCRLLGEMDQRHVEVLQTRGLTPEAIQACDATLRRLQGAWALA